MGSFHCSADLIAPADIGRPTKIGYTASKGRRTRSGYAKAENRFSGATLILNLIP